MKRPRAIAAALITFVLLAIYATTYVILSRRGMAVARSLDLSGYYFAEPASPAGEQLHLVCCYAFRPLVLIDRTLGTEMEPASLPLKQLD